MPVKLPSGDMMMLVVDAGNSRLKWGMAPARADVAAGAWFQLGVVENARLEGLAQQWAGLPRPERVLCANVAGDASVAAVTAALAPWRVKAIWLEAQARAAGVLNRYDVPAQLGPDRWASAIGAWHRKRSACIVVNAGTATTIDFVSESAEFLGGMILPGVALMKESLHHGTAALGLQSGSIHLQSRRTSDAIETGCVVAQLGAIDRARQGYVPGVPVLLSGGARSALAAALAAPVEEVPHLALEGLYVLACALEQPA
jgi:type III pantothenate kinase